MLDLYCLSLMCPGVLDHYKQTNEMSIKVTEASEKIEKMFASISGISSRNTEIAAAAEEQSLVSVNLTSSIEQIKSLSESNTGEVARANQLSSTLNELVQRVDNQLRRMSARHDV